MCNADKSHTLLVARTTTAKSADTSRCTGSPTSSAGLRGIRLGDFVLKNERQRGYGRALIEAVKELATEKGCVRLALLNSRNRPPMSASTTGGSAGPSAPRWRTSFIPWASSRKHRPGASPTR